MAGTFGMKMVFRAFCPAMTIKKLVRVTLPHGIGMGPMSFGTA
jgi:hypothetical protein